ncbi:MAG: response regulator, partial [Myxococcota bacterium]
GTVITIEVPARRKSLAANEDAPVTTPSMVAAARVLLVDDDPTLRTVLERALQRAGYLVKTASDGLEALNLIEDETDILVTDLIMPRMGGLELARRVRRAFPRVRVLLLSGHPEVTDRLEAGGAEWVSKPLDARTIVARIQDTLDRRAS